MHAVVFQRRLLLLATLIPGTVQIRQKIRKKINGDQEDCRLDLKLASDDS